MVIGAIGDSAPLNSEERLGGLSGSVAIEESMPACSGEEHAVDLWMFTSALADSLLSSLSGRDRLEGASSPLRRCSRERRLARFPADVYLNLSALVRAS